MTNEQLIEKLIEQINNNMQIFLGILGFLVAVFAFFQWRISQSQLKNLKAKAKAEAINEITEKYKLDKLEDSYSKLQSLTEQISELKKQNNTLKSSIESLESVRQIQLIQEIKSVLELALSTDSDKPSAFESRLMILLLEFIGNDFVHDIEKMTILVFVFNKVRSLKDNKAAQRIKKFIEANGKKYLDQWDNLSKTFNDKGSGTTQKD